MKEIDILEPRAFTKFCMSIGAVPSSYIAGLTIEEQLLWFCSYLEKEVIPAVNNNGEAVTELQGLYIQLKEYVDNYFDNLDIQEEINNKLDEMAESGELAEIIAQYIELKGVLAYDTVADMKAADNVVNGSIARTLGFYAYNDGGGAYYKIRDIINTDVVDEKHIFSITNNVELVAELVEEGVGNVKQWGAKGDGTNDDTDYIQACIDNSATTLNKIYFPSGTYRISEPLEFNYGTTRTEIELDGNARIKPLAATIECVIKLAASGTAPNVRERPYLFHGGIIDCNQSNCGIKVVNGTSFTSIRDVNIIHFVQYGIYMPGTDSNDTRIDNCQISGSNVDNYENFGIYSAGKDIKVTNCQINQIKTGVYCAGGGNLISQTHVLGIFHNQPDGYAGTVAFHFNSGAMNNINQCYCDTMQTFVKSTANIVNVCNSFYYSYIDDQPTKLFNITDTSKKLKITNCDFVLPANATNQGIVMSSLNKATLTKDFLYLEGNTIGNASTLVQGDLINAVYGGYTPFWVDNGVNIKNNWVKIGYVTDIKNLNLDITVDNRKFSLSFETYYNNGNCGLNANSKIAETGHKIKLGFKYENNTNGYNVYSVWLKQSDPDGLMANNLQLEASGGRPFIKLQEGLATPATTTTDPNTITEIAPAS